MQMWKWSDLMFGLAIRQFLLLKPSILYDSIRWSHSFILRESYLLRASDTTERNSMNTHTPASFQNLQQSPLPNPNNSILTKVGNNVLCYNKHYRLVDMSQNVLVRNSIGRKGWGLLCFHSFHPRLPNRQEVTLSASRLGTLFLEIGSSEHATQSGKIQDRLVLCQQTRIRTLQLHVCFKVCIQSIWDVQQIYLVSFMPSSAWSPLPSLGCSRKTGHWVIQI
jgi:hypothetical protein